MKEKNLKKLSENLHILEEEIEYGFQNNKTSFLQNKLAQRNKLIEEIKKLQRNHFGA
tara:strand:- start:6014 stop:6184 length:171 start_codon:yes stop_codon:yes gene_type:complete